jgi:hypothetical protein
MRRRARPFVGLVCGVAGGLVLLLIASVLLVLEGAGGLDRFGIDFGTLAALYLVGGAISGVAVGTMLPMTVHRWGAVVVGGLAALPLYHGAGMLLGDTDCLTTVFLSAVVGGIVGFNWWEPVANEAEITSEGSHR